MSWLFYAILSPAVYSIVNFVDKYILSKQIRDYCGMSMYASIMALIFGTSFWIFTGFPKMSANDAILVIISGILTLWAQALYFKVLSSEQTSKVIILFQMGPVITLLLSFLFLKEVITFKQFIGFIAILASTVGVSLKNDDLRFKLDSSFFLILINQILWSTGAVLFKFVVDDNSFVKVVAYESWGIALGGLLLFTFSSIIRQAFLKTLKTLKKSALGFVFLNEGIFVIGRLLTFLAISLGPLYLVSVLSSTSVFFGIFLGLILTLLWPKIFQEDTSIKGVIKGLAFASLAFIGIALIY
jgi:transporter family protein